MSVMDREFSDELTGLMPIVSHGISGVDCSGRIVAAVENRPAIPVIATASIPQLAPSRNNCLKG